MISTVDALYEKHGDRHLNLEEVSEEYFGLKPKTAVRYAREKKLEVKAKRLGKNWFIDIVDLAKVLESK